MHSRAFVLSLALFPLFSATAQSTIPARTGNFAQIAVGHFDAAGQRGFWNTTLVFMNAGSAPANVQVKFFASSGQALALPVKGGGTAAERQVTVPGYGSARIEFDESASPLAAGWAQVTAGAAIRGQGIYRTRVPGRADFEAAVPLLVRESGQCLVPLPGDAASFPDALLLPFDNTSGNSTSVAFANVTSASATLDLEFLNEAGAPLLATQIPFQARAHTAFDTRDHPALRDRRGMIRVRQDAASFGGIAFLFNPGGPFTTLLPVVR